MLTERQREILAHHANGMTLMAISQQMYLSYITVRKDIEKAKRTLGAHTLAHAVCRGLMKGELEISGTGVNAV